MERSLVIISTCDANLEKMVSDAVQQTCHGLRKADSTDDARRLLNGSRKVALAIVDLDSENHGVPLLEALQDCEPKFPILLVTESVDMLELRPALAQLATDYVLKPVDPEELRQKIRELCMEGDMGFDEYSFHPSRPLPYSGPTEADCVLAVWLTDSSAAGLPAHPPGN